MNKNILIIGDYETSHWHPLKGVDERLEKILAGNTVKITADYTALTSAELKLYDLLICYTDDWKEKGTKQTTGAILSYIAEGGALLSIHCGIIMRSTPEMELMQGGRFTGHPEACDLTYTPTGNHAILEGIEAFTVFEEPYRITMVEFAEHEMLLTYSHEGQDWAAGWSLTYGMGKVVYLSFGHQGKTFDNDMAAKLVINSVKWCTSE